MNKREYNLNFIDNKCFRLKKQSEENERVIKENQTKINGVNDKYNILQNEYDKLKIVKESLEVRILLYLLQ